MAAHPITRKYPLDLSGQHPNNLVIAEPHTLDGDGQRALAPLYGVFYSDSLVVRDVDSGKTLAPYEQFKALQLYPDITSKTGQEVTGLILITDDQVSNNIEIDYQVVGGEYAFTAFGLQELLKTAEIDGRTIVWGDVVGKPNAYAPAPHLHNAGDVYGFEYLVESVEQLRQAVLASTGGSTLELRQYIEMVHDEMRQEVKDFQSQIDAHEASVRQSLDELIKRINDHEAFVLGKLNGYEDQLDNFDKRLTDGLADIRSEVNDLGDQFQASYDAAIADIQRQINEHEQYIAQELSKIRADIQSFKDKVNASIAAFDARLTAAETRIEDAIEEFRRDLNALEQYIQDEVWRRDNAGHIQFPWAAQYLELDNEEWDRIPTPSIGGSLTYDATSGLALIYGNNGTKPDGAGIAALLDVRNTIQGHGIKITGGRGVNSRPKIEVVDGAGSGLDADLLDGQHGNFYQNASNLNTGTLSNDRLSGNYSFAGLTLSGKINAAGGTLSNGLSFGSATLSEPTDLSRHLAIWGDSYGFSVTDSTLNIVAEKGNSGQRIDLYGGTTRAMNNFEVAGTTHLKGETSFDGRLILNGQEIHFTHPSDRTNYARFIGSNDDESRRLEINSQFGGILGTGRTDSGFYYVYRQVLEWNPSGVNITSGTLKEAGQRVWSPRNQGSGTGMDADTVDTLQADQFLRSDVSDTARGSIYFANGVTFGSKTVSDAKVLTNHIDLYDGRYGLSVSSNTINIVSNAGDGAVDIHRDANIKRNLTVGGIVNSDLRINNGTNTTVTIENGSDGGQSTLNIRGTGANGTGRLFVGSGSRAGGGLIYDYDDGGREPGAGNQHLALYRFYDGSYYWTARNHETSSTWEFRENPTVLNQGRVLVLNDLAGTQPAGTVPETNRTNRWSENQIVAVPDNIEYNTSFSIPTSGVSAATVSVDTGYVIQLGEVSTSLFISGTIHKSKTGTSTWAGTTFKIVVAGSQVSVTGEGVGQTSTKEFFKVVKYTVDGIEYLGLATATTRYRGAFFFTGYLSNLADLKCIAPADLPALTVQPQMGTTDVRSVLRVMSNLVWHEGNMGTGSGLDADLLDGSQKQTSVTDTTSGSVLVVGAFGLGNYGVSLSNLGTDRNGFIQDITGADGWTGFDSVSSAIQVKRDSKYGFRIGWARFNSGRLYFQQQEGSWSSLRDIWHSGYQGSGTGMDADTVDGLQADQLLRRDISDTFSGQTLTFNRDGGGIRFDTGGNDFGGMRFYNPGGNSGRLEIYTEDDNDEPILITTSGNERARFHRDNIEFTSSVTNFTTDHNRMRRGFNGGYNSTAGSGQNWASSIWGIGDDWDGSNYGVNWSSGNMYGFAWVRDQHTEADSAVGDGLYIYRNGSKVAGFGEGGSKFYRPVTMTSSLEVGGHALFKGRAFVDRRMNTTSGISLAIGDSDTGFNWVTDGQFELYANAQPVARVTTGGGFDVVGGTLREAGQRVWSPRNQGSGTGLDADLLDGFHASSISKDIGATTISSPVDNSFGTPSDLSNYPSIKGFTGIVSTHKVGGRRYQWVVSHQRGYSNVEAYVRLGNTLTLDDSTATPFARMWHDHNHGTGSGLDADLLDGAHGSQYLRNDLTNQTIKANLRIQGSGTGDGNVSYVEFIGSDGNRTGYVGDGSSGSGNVLINSVNGRVEIRDTSGNGSVWHTANDGPGSGMDADTVDGKHYDDMFRTIMDSTYPVDSVVWSTSSTNPATKYNMPWSTWERYAEGRVLVSQGYSDTTYSANSFGGSSYVRLTMNEIPRHRHVLFKGADSSTGYNQDPTTTASAGRNDTGDRDFAIGRYADTEPDFAASSYEGFGYSHENRMPYRVAYAWVRTA